ncbi:MAG: protein-S-isoprenylcysteine O-methyltransferase [Pseudomonadota bacterium]
MKKLGTIVGWLIFFTLVALSIWRWEINGYGMFVWIAMAIGMSIIRAPHTKKNAQNTVVSQTAASQEKVLLALVGLGGTFIPIIHLATGFLSFANYQLPAWSAAVGAALIIPGLYLFWRSHADLGRNWSVTTEIHNEQTLITNGIYSRIRHPMYSAIWLGFLAQPLLIHNWIAGFGGPVAFAIMYFMRVPYEEAMMKEKFGTEYEAYMQRSGRLFPG